MDQEEQSLLERYRQLRRKKRIIGFLFGGSTLTIGAIVLGLLFFLLLIIGGRQESSVEGDGTIGGNINLSPTVLALAPIVEREAKAQGIPQLVPLLLAIMQVESGGSLPDPMQSSESAGLPVGTLADAESSIKQGVKHFKSSYDSATLMGCDVWTAVQAYNFGTAYITYVASNGKTTNTKIADNYSRTVVAPSLGNTSGTTYNYPNPVAIPYNGGKLYLNGGNFFYDLLVKQFIQTNASGGQGNGNNTATGWKKAAIENARRDIGQSFPTGWGQRGECIVAVQGWINGAKAGTFIPGDVRSGYLGSGAKEVPWNQAQSGDVVQYENLGDPDLFATGVHTMLVESVNKDGTINVIESNNPGGSGLVGARQGLTNTAPSGWRAVVWRFP